MGVCYWSVRSRFDNVKKTFAIRMHAGSVRTCVDSVSTGMYSERQRTYTESAKFECKLAVLIEHPNIRVSNSKFAELSNNYNKQNLM